MKCRDAKYLISLLYDAQLDDRRRRKLNAHLDVCNECRAELRALEELSAGFKSLDTVEPSDGGWERLVNQLETAKPAHRSLVPAFGFAIALILITVSVALFALHRKQSQPIVVKPIQKKEVIVKKPAKQPDSVENIKNNEQTKPESVVIKHSTKPMRTPVVEQRSWKKHNKKLYKRNDVSPEPQITPEIDQPENKYIVQADPEPFNNPDLSAEADMLFTTGMSVLVEASLSQNRIEKGDSL